MKPNEVTIMNQSLKFVLTHVRKFYNYVLKNRFKIFMKAIEILEMYHMIKFVIWLFKTTIVKYI